MKCPPQHPNRGLVKVYRKVLKEVLIEAFHGAQGSGYMDPEL
jgi:hypothetical protein